MRSGASTPGSPWGLSSSKPGLVWPCDSRVCRIPAHGPGRTIMAASVESLAKVPLFQDLNKGTLKRLEKVVRERRFKAGETIVSQGDEGVGFFLIDAGKVEVSRDGQSLATLGPGDFF